MKSAEFSYFDRRRFSPRERSEIKRRGYRVLNFPRALNKKKFLGYALKDEISFRDKNLKGKKVILIKKGLKGRELKRTFWHEVAHFRLRKGGADKQLRKREREAICERFAIKRAR